MEEDFIGSHRSNIDRPRGGLSSNPDNNPDNNPPTAEQLASNHSRMLANRLCYAHKNAATGIASRAARTASSPES